MLIRIMEEKDIDDVVLLYESLIEQKSNKKNMIEKFLLMNNNDNYILIVVEENGRIVGTVMGIICFNMVADFNSFLVIEAVIVDNAYRGKGIGKSMLIELENRAKERDCSYSILVSGIQRKEAHKMYEALGYGKDEVRGFRKFLKTETT